MCWRALFSKSTNPGCEFIEGGCIVHTRTTNTETGYNTHRHRTILLLALLYNPDGYSLSYRFPRRLKNNLTIESIGRYRGLKGCWNEPRALCGPVIKYLDFCVIKTLLFLQAKHYTTLLRLCTRIPSTPLAEVEGLVPPSPHPSDTPLHVL